MDMSATHHSLETQNKYCGCWIRRLGSFHFCGLDCNFWFPFSMYYLQPRLSINSLPFCTASSNVQSMCANMTFFWWSRSKQFGAFFWTFRCSPAISPARPKFLPWCQTVLLQSCAAHRSSSPSQRPKGVAWPHIAWPLNNKKSEAQRLLCPYVYT